MPKILIITIDQEIYDSLHPDDRGFDHEICGIGGGRRKYCINYMVTIENRCYYEFDTDTTESFIEECLISVGVNFEPGLIKEWEVR